jgi:uncharacterized membrane protein
VCTEAIDFEILLIKTFQQLVHYGADDMMVMKEIFKALQVIDENSNDQNHKTIMEFGQYTLRKLERQDYDKEELKVIQREIDELRNETKTR